MKAAQRFMRPVKEMREGFFSMAEPDNTPRSASTLGAPVPSLGLHQISATRHFVEQYRSCAEDAGLIASEPVTSSRLGSPRSGMLRSSLYSRAATPRLVAGLGGNASDDEGDSSPATEVLQSARTLPADLLLGSASLAQHQPV